MKQTMFSKNTFFRIFLLLLILILLLGYSDGFAQDVATNQALANVLPELVVMATQNLDFGDVYQGISKTVDKNDAVNAGIFDIQGAPNATLSLYLTLPSYISLADGSDRMTISFGLTSCDVDTALAALPGTPGAFNDGFPGVDPNNLPDAATTGDAGFCSLYIGGKVTPSVDQKAGAYAGDITITVAYTGT
jgi:hypothetical protein